MKFEEWLAEIIKQKKVNLSELSRKTGVCYQSVYDSLFGKRGNRELRSSELLAICVYVGVNPMDFKKVGE